VALYRSVWTAEQLRSASERLTLCSRPGDLRFTVRVLPSA
jgi:hypothetical protein